MRRLAIVLCVSGWTLACILPVPHDHDTPPGDLDPEVFPPPDGTTLWGQWGGPVHCPDGGEGTLGLDLVHEGPAYFEGPAVIEWGEPSRRIDGFVAIGYPYSSEEVVFVLDVAAFDCADESGPIVCPQLEDVVWDQTELPAWITGELWTDAEAEEPCAFELQAI
jgi:hypothetical protein